jgi:hypothetical protein
MRSLFFSQRTIGVWKKDTKDDVDQGEGYDAMFVHFDESLKLLAILYPCGIKKKNLICPVDISVTSCLFLLLIHGKGKRNMKTRRMHAL